MKSVILSGSREPAIAKGYHNEGPIHYDLLYDLFDAESAEVAGIAHDDEYTAIIPSSVSGDLFSRQPVLSDRKQQRLYQLRQKVASERDVLIYRSPKIQFNKVFSRVEMGTFVTSRNNSHVNVLDDEEVVSCTGSNQDGLAGNCRTFYKSKWDCGTSGDCLSGKPTEIPITGATSGSYTQMGCYAQIDASVQVSITGNTLLAELQASIDALGGVGFYIAPGRFGKDVVHIYDGEWEIPLERALQFPTKIDLKGYVIGFDLAVTSDVDVKNIAIDLPFSLKYYRDFKAGITMTGKLGNNIPNYYSFDASRPSISSNSENNLPGTWEQAMDLIQKIDISMTPVLNLGLRLRIHLGEEHVDSTVGFDMGAKLDFNINKDECTFPFLYGDRTLFVDWKYHFSPTEIIETLAQVILGSWYSSVMAVFEQVKGILSDFVEQLKSKFGWLGWLINPLIEVIETLEENSDKSFRIWDAEAHDICLVGEAGQEGLSDMVDSAGGAAVIFWAKDFTGTATAVLERNPEFKVDLEIYKNQNALTNGQKAEKVYNFASWNTHCSRNLESFVVHTGDSFEGYVSRYYSTELDPFKNDYAEMKSVSSGHTSFDMTTSRTSEEWTTGDKDPKLNFKVDKYVGRKVGYGKEFRCKAETEAEYTYYTFDKDAVLDGSDYGMICNNNGYSVNHDTYKGLDSAQISGSSLTTGYYRKKKPVSITLKSLTQTLDQKATYVLTFFSCPKDKTTDDYESIESDCLPINSDKLFEIESGSYTYADDISFEIELEDRQLGVVTNRAYVWGILPKSKKIGSLQSYSTGSRTFTHGEASEYTMTFSFEQTEPTPGFLVQSSSIPGDSRAIICRYIDISTDTTGIPQIVDLSETGKANDVSFKNGEKYGILRVVTSLDVGTYNQMNSLNFAAIVKLPGAKPLVEHEVLPDKDTYIVYLKFGESMHAGPTYKNHDLTNYIAIHIPFRRSKKDAATEKLQFIRFMTIESEKAAMCSDSTNVPVVFWPTSSTVKVPGGCIEIVNGEKTEEWTFLASRPTGTTTEFTITEEQQPTDAVNYRIRGAMHSWSGSIAIGHLKPRVMETSIPSNTRTVQIPSERMSDLMSADIPEERLYRISCDRCTHVAVKCDQSQTLLTKRQSDGKFVFPVEHALPYTVTGVFSNTADSSKAIPSNVIVIDESTDPDKYYLASYEHSQGLIDIRDDWLANSELTTKTQGSTVLFENVNNQIIKGGLYLFDKMWTGAPKYTEIEGGNLLLTFTPVLARDNRMMRMSATLGTQKIPFSPEKFMTSEEYVKQLGLQIDDIPEGEFIFSYMPTGEVAMNLDYFDNTSLPAVSARLLDEQIYTFIDVPVSMVESVKYFFADPEVIDLDNSPGITSEAPPPDDDNTVTVIAIVAAVVVVVVVAVIGTIFYMKRKKSQGKVDNDVEP